MIGRLEVYETLARQRQEALAGRGGITFLEGETGVGKTTILEAVSQESLLHDFQVISGRAAAEAAAPFQLIRSVVRDADRAVAMPPGGAVAPLSVPYYGEAEPTSGLPFVVGGGPDPAEEGAEASEGSMLFRSIALENRTRSERNRLLEGLAEPILSLARQAPVLMTLEDVQWADEGSLGFLEYLAPTLAHRRLWVVATSRPFDRIAPSVRAALERLVASGAAMRLPVRGLNEREVVDFVRWRAPERDVPTAQANRWYAQTGGNPLFLEQLLGAPAGAPVGSLEGVEDREEFFRQRVRALSESERRILTIAAVLGTRIGFGALARTTDEHEEALAEAVERLVHEGLLRETGNEVFEFVRPELQEELYNGLTETRRRILHRRVGEAIEAAHPTDIESVYALARHFALGRVDAKAYEYNRRAAEFADRTFFPGIALVHLERALEAHRRARPNQPVEEVGLLLDMVRQLRRVGELDRAERTLRQVLDRPDRLAVATGRQRDLLTLFLALVRSDQGRWAEADRLVEELIRSHGPDWEPELRLVAVRLAGEFAYFRGDYAAALAHHAQGLATATAVGNERERLLEEVRYARSLSMRPGGLAESIERLRAAGRALEAMGEKAEAAEARLYVGVALGMQDDLVTAQREFEESLRLARDAGDPRRVGWALFDLADTANDLGDVDAADRYNREARAHLEQVGDRFGLAQTYLYEGKIRRRRGDPAGAEAALRRALAVFEEQRMEADVVEVRFHLAELDADRGDWPAVEREVRALERRRILELRPDLATAWRALHDRRPR